MLLHVMFDMFEKKNKTKQNPNDVIELQIVTISCYDFESQGQKHGKLNAEISYFGSMLVFCKCLYYFILRYKENCCQLYENCVLNLDKIWYVYVNKRKGKRRKVSNFKTTVSFRQDWLVCHVWCYRDFGKTEKWLRLIACTVTKYCKFYRDSYEITVYCKIIKMFAKVLLMILITYRNFLEFVVKIYCQNVFFFLQFVVIFTEIYW